MSSALPSPPASPFLTGLSRLFQRSEVGLLVAIVVVVVLTGVLDTQHNYFTDPGPSAVNILRQTSLLGIFTLGAAIVIIAGGIDLSFGSMIAFSGGMCATFLIMLAPEEMRRAQPVGMTTMVLAITGTLVVGLLIGSFHAWLITVVRLPPFVATLASLVGLRSLARVIVESATLAQYGAKNTQIQIYDEQFRYLTTSDWIPAVLFLVLAALAWLLMSRTVVGRHLHALGGNEQAARLSGIRTNELKWLAYCLSAVLASVAGVLYICGEGTADPQQQARGYELNAIAAAVVGGCSLRGGVGTIPGAVLGALFLRTVIDGVAKIIKTGADVYEGLIVGTVVVLAVAFTQWRQSSRQGMQFFAGPLGIVTIANLALLVGVLTAVLGGGWLWSGVAAAATVALLFVMRLLESRRRG